MGFWIYMLVMDLLIPATMIGSGLLMFKRVPRSIGGLYGYRTRRSTQNRDTWVFAHRYCGKLWFWCGIVMVPVSAVVLLPFIRQDVDTVALVGMVLCLAQCVVMLVTIFLTERALKKNFDQYGRRRRSLR